jgi:hypothetical protein
MTCSARPRVSPAAFLHPVLGLAVAALVLLPSAPLAAQGGAMQVRVTSNERPVVEATVDLIFMGRVLHRAGTDAEGLMTVAALPAGTFTVRVEALGYRRHLEEGVRVELGGKVEVDIDLEEQAIELEGITVQSERTRIERENTEFSTRIDDIAIKMLPLSHDAREIVALTPGARPGHVWGGANFQANSYRIDGLSANHPGMGGDLLQPSVNWIDEIHVRGLGAGAEHGGFQGGLIDVVTKRGTNTFEGMLRTNFEDGALNASNLVSTEIGREVSGRYDVEGEVRGPLIPDRLHYYLSGTRISETRQALNHLRQFEDRIAPIAEERTEEKLFGKLNWTPRPTHEFTLSAAYTNVTADNFEITGYEAPGASHRYTSPTWFVNTSWRSILGNWGIVEARANHFSNDERRDSYGGEDVPGVSTFALTPPFNAYRNNPYTLRSAPTSSAANVMGTFRLPTGSVEQVLRIGGEYMRGTFLNRRIRNGGMTWLPTNSGAFEPDDPATWNSFTWLPSQWGGEVHLDADVTNASAFAQTALTLGSRVVVTPGVRWNRWEGFLTTRQGERFRAVEDQAWDPRIGISLALVEDGTFVAKGHWGRFHQDLITQMFDRAAGADVFTNEEIWYYWGDRFTDPGTRFSEAERDALAAQNLFRRESVVALNETGPVLDYKQPYIDQWLVALEKQFGYGVKMEALYTRRSNRAMVALVDRNRASNYTRFERVRVFDSSGILLPYSGGSVFLEEVYLPNYVLLERIRCKVTADCPDAASIPDMPYADSVNLTWNPDHVLTTAPDAKREFNQFQFTLEIAQPLWGASFSFVTTHLEGNLDNVSGYTDPEEFTPGPYVRVNEGVNAYGTLENFADKEAKLSIWGNLGERTRVGGFWTFRTGDHYSPRFRITHLGFNQYRVNTGPATMAGGGLTLTDRGDNLDYALFWPLEGHHVYVGPRGRPTLRRRANLDLRVEHMFDFQGSDLALSLELFNVAGDESITELQTMVNNGPDYWYYLRDQLPFSGVPANQYYQAAQERVRPRSLRLGVAVYF